MASAYLIATFAEPRALVDAVAAIRARGFKIYDVYAPCPVHGLDEAMGIRRSRLPYVTLVAGVLACAATVAFEFYVAVFDWALNIGGKPDNSTLAFVPIAFEMTVLGAGLATAAAFLLRAGLFPGSAPKLAGPPVTDDTFAVALRWRPNAFDTGEARNLLIENGATDIRQMVGDL